MSWCNTNTINHNMLLERLRASGFCDDIINWFHSDLTDPAFLVCIENEYSSITTISIEVPEGSIHGPLLFLIYGNDMKQAESSDLILYADGLCLYFHINMSPKLKHT